LLISSKNKTTEQYKAQDEEKQEKDTNNEHLDGYKSNAGGLQRRQ
jgi:hypothetical protein